MKSILPNYFLDRLFYLKNHRFKRSHEKDFTEIHEENHWGSKETPSGRGSELASAENAINAIGQIIKDYRISSIIDLACGDFNWMKQVDLGNSQYLGVDIVDSLIDQNYQYKSDLIQFKKLNMVRDQIPKKELVIVRDVWVHMPFEDIHQTVRNIKASGSKYLLCTHFEDYTFNFNIPTGKWRPLNLKRKPFYFPDSEYQWLESFPMKYKKDFRGKSLALWEVNKLPNF